MNGDGDGHGDYGEDPYAFISLICQVPPEVEERWRVQPFLFETDFPVIPGGSDRIPVASTGITTSSSAETLGGQQNGGYAPRDAAAEVFHTTMSSAQQQLELELWGLAVIAAQDAEEMEAVDGDCVDDSAEVDLGRDTDLGFCPETESTGRSESDSGLNSFPGVNGTRNSEDMGKH